MCSIGGFICMFSSVTCKGAPRLNKKIPSAYIKRAIERLPRENCFSIHPTCLIQGDSLTSTPSAFLRRPPHSFAMFSLKNLVFYSLALYNLCVPVTGQSSSSTSAGAAPSPTGDLKTILEREFTYTARAQTNVSQIPAW